MFMAHMFEEPETALLQNKKKIEVESIFSILRKEMCKICISLAKCV